MESMTSNLNGEKIKNKERQALLFWGVKYVFIKKRFVKFQPACQEKSSLGKAVTPVRKSPQSDPRYRLQSFLPCVLKGFLLVFLYISIYLFNAYNYNEIKGATASAHPLYFDLQKENLE